MNFMKGFLMNSPAKDLFIRAPVKVEKCVEFFTPG